MPTFVLKQACPGQLQLGGPVDFSSADALRCQGLAIFEATPNCKNWTIDLSHLEKIDSALLAAFLDWARCLAKNSGRLICTQVPDSLSRLMTLYGLDSVLL